MKRTLAAFVAGIALGSAGLGIASSQESWTKNGVICTPTGSGPTRGVVCSLLTSKRLAVVNQHSIIIGVGKKVLYVTSSR
jgi:hypothetical protein